MMNCSRLQTTLCLMCLIVLSRTLSTTAFSVVGQRSHRQCSNVEAALQSPLFLTQSRPHKLSRLGRFMTESEGEAAAEEENEAGGESMPVVTEEESSAVSDDSSEGGMWKTVLLAGPLFLKFVVVLLIKFITDLIVFPLLWLYRFARMTKNKMLKMIGKGPGSDAPVNGATS